MDTLDRRRFVTLLTTGLLGSRARLAFASSRKRVAAIVTEYRHRSHADVIVSRFLNGYSANAVLHEPRTDIVSMYTDQVPENDMSRGISKAHDLPIYPTIREALTQGGRELDVDAVLLIGEHGDYPNNEKGQKLYPRYELFGEIVDVFRRSRRSVPVFCDKHLSYSWKKARQMYGQAQELGIPFMAGSSIPVTVRVPELEIPRDTRLESAVAVGYGGVESYGFHTLEVLQCMVERRAGGETGIAAVETLEGDAVWRWRDSPQGRWSRSLLDAALARAHRTEEGRVEDNAKAPVLFVLSYRDGLEGAVYMLSGHLSEWTFASRIMGQSELVSTRFGSPGLRDLPHFDGLVYCIEEMFVTGKPLYPVERTLLVTGALDFLMESLHQKKRIETPELQVAYRAPLNDFFQRA